MQTTTKGIHVHAKYITSRTFIFIPYYLGCEVYTAIYCDKHTAFQKHHETTGAISCSLNLYDTLSKLIYKSCILSGELYTVMPFYANIKDTHFYWTKPVLQNSRRNQVIETDMAPINILESTHCRQISINRYRRSLVSLKLLVK